MKRLAIFLSLMLILSASSLFAPYRNLGTLYDTAVNVNASATDTKTTWTADEIIRISKRSHKPHIAITYTFTRAAGAADTLDFWCQVSYDGGTTWSILNGSEAKIPTNTAVISGTTVRLTYEFNTYGVSHIKAWKIVNNDGANNVTACNATVSIWTE